MTPTGKAASSRKGGAARSENGRRSFKYEGLELDLPGKLPFKVLRHIAPDSMDVAGALTAIVGDEQMEEVWNADLDLDQGEELVRQILELYDMSAGKSSASAGS